MDEAGRCFLCGKNGAADRLDRHHIFGGPYRKKSSHYGLVVRLCHHDCHIFGPNAAHKNAVTSRLLKQQGQLWAMEQYGWSIADFIREFGRNYLD